MKPLPRQSSRFDEHRNSSRVWPVEPGALRAAQRALEALHRDEPALCAWIAEGAPTLSELEHEQRFGAPYGKATRAPAARAR